MPIPKELKVKLEAVLHGVYTNQGLAYFNLDLEAAHAVYMEWFEPVLRVELRMAGEHYRLNERKRIRGYIGFREADESNDEFIYSRIKKVFGRAT